MSQYVLNPTDPTGNSAINLIQPLENGSYPVIIGEVYQAADDGVYSGHVNGRNFAFMVIEAEGKLDGILPHVHQQRRMVVPPHQGEDDLDTQRRPAALAVEKTEGSNEFVAIRLGTDPW
jgi:hypothetical protein